MTEPNLPRVTALWRYGARLRLSNLLAAAFLAVAAPAAAAEVTIVAFGDSLTQGYGLPEADGFVPQLQDWLRANGAPEAVVINAGVSGDTTAGGRARIDWALTEDVDAVIVALGGNDILRGIDPAESRRNLDTILAAVQARGLPVLLAGLPAPGNYGPDYKRDWNAIFPALTKKYDAILYPNFLAGLSKERNLAEARALLQRDGLHPDAEGVRVIVADIGPVVLKLVAAAQQ